MPAYTIQHANGGTNVNWGYGNDNMAFDNDGNLWLLQDGDNNYIWVVKSGHTQANPQVEIFGSTPTDSEPTGITFSPDNQFLFISIQHPSSSNSASTQTDEAGNEVAFDKDTALVIALKENLGSTIGTEYDWYLDADGDGYAVLPIITSATSPGTGYTQNVLPTTDCDDSDSIINPTTIWYLNINSELDSENTIVSCKKPGEEYTLIEPTTLSTLKKIVAYPNPAKETIEIGLSEIQSIINVTIVNSNKQLVFEKQFENKRVIDIKLVHISSGIYFIHLSNEGGHIASKKIIKL